MFEPSYLLRDWLVSQEVWIALELPRACSRICPVLDFAIDESANGARCFQSTIPRYTSLEICSAWPGILYTGTRTSMNDLIDREYVTSSIDELVMMPCLKLNHAKTIRKQCY